MFFLCEFSKGGSLCVRVGACVCVCGGECDTCGGECDAKVWLKRATLHCIKYILPLTYTHSLASSFARFVSFDYM